MEKVKILVVEDEVIIADNICDTLEELDYEVLEPAINFTEAIETIEKDRPDIAILDIQLSGRKTGIDLAEVIREKYDFPFVFLTSNADIATVKEAKKVMPSAYLIKPFSKEELFTSIEIALSNYSKRKETATDRNLAIKDFLFIKDKGTYRKVYFKDILYIKSSHVYVEVFLEGQQKFVVRTGLSNILKKLDANFIRIHRGYIINTTYLTQIHSMSVSLKTVEIPVGKKYKELVLRQLD